MQLPPLTLIEGNKLLVSPSQLSTMKTCPTMWLYKYLHRREGNHAAPARDAGKAFHSAIEAGFKVARTGADAATQLATARDELHRGFKGFTLPDGEYRTEVRYAEVLEKYQEHWRHEQFETLGIEVPFAVELGQVSEPYNGGGERTLTVVLNGIIDRIISFDGITWVADSKTMNKWADWTQDEWARAAQPKLYAWALSQLQHQHPELGLPSGVKGFMLDAIIIRKPSESSRVKLPREEFKRLRYAYTAEQLEETRQNALGWVEAIVGMTATGCFLQSEHACAYNFGRRCTYWDVCTVPAEQRMLVLQSDLYRDKQDGMAARAAEAVESEEV